jgi:hypothetical protein
MSQVSKTIGQSLIGFGSVRPVLYLAFAAWMPQLSGHTLSVGAARSSENVERLPHVKTWLTFCITFREISQTRL